MINSIFPRKWFLGIMVLFAVIVGLSASVISADGHDNGTDGHESCNPLSRFIPVGDDLDWGVNVLCSSAVNYIYVEGELQYWAEEIEAYIEVDFVSRTCATYQCPETIIYEDALDGLYRIKNCFEASSPTSTWNWACTYKYYLI